MAAGQKGVGQGAGQGAGHGAVGKDQDALVAFAEEVKAWRAARGWTQGELGAAVNYSESMIAQVEACFKPATMQLAEALDRVFGTPGYAKGEPGKPGTPGTFMRLATRIRKMSFPVAFRPFTGFEEEATALYICEHAFFPGLLQTEEYARAQLATYPDATDELVTERLAARMSRQELLTRDKPPRLWVLLYEPILQIMVDSPATMHGQLMRIAEASRKPNITVQVLPTRMLFSMQGSFHVAEIGGVSTATYIDDVTDGRTTQDPALINWLSERFRYLQTEAMSPGESRELVEKVAQERCSKS